MYLRFIFLLLILKCYLVWEMRAFSQCFWSLSIIGVIFNFVYLYFDVIFVDMDLKITHLRQPWYREWLWSEGAWCPGEGRGHVEVEEEGAEEPVRCSLCNPNPRLSQALRLRRLSKSKKRWYPLWLLSTLRLPLLYLWVGLVMYSMHSLRHLIELNKN